MYASHGALRLCRGIRTLSRCRRCRGREAAVEYLFSRISPLVIEAAERLAARLIPRKCTPDRTIAMHVRWGDKISETKLIPMENYVNAIQLLADAYNLETPCVVFMTEDPSATLAFRSMIRKDFFIIVNDQAIFPNSTTHSKIAAQESNGSIGLQSLLSLLMSTEANYFVLTTDSNWSRLINSIRSTIIDRQCGNCTVMVDMSQGLGREASW